MCPLRHDRSSPPPLGLKNGHSSLGCTFRHVPTCNLHRSSTSRVLLHRVCVYDELPRDDVSITTPQPPQDPPCCVNGFSDRESCYGCWTHPPTSKDSCEIAMTTTVSRPILSDFSYHVFNHHQHHHHHYHHHQHHRKIIDSFFYCIVVRYTRQVRKRNPS